MKRFHNKSPNRLGFQFIITSSPLTWAFSLALIGVALVDIQRLKMKCFKSQADIGVIHHLTLQRRSSIRSGLNSNSITPRLCWSTNAKKPCSPANKGL